jgi:hypothetical protein
MMEEVRTSETSVNNHFTRQYNPEDRSEHHTHRRENLKSYLQTTLHHKPEDQHWLHYHHENFNIRWYSLLWNILLFEEDHNYVRTKLTISENTLVTNRISLGWRKLYTENFCNSVEIILYVVVSGEYTAWLWDTKTLHFNGETLEW